MINFERQFHKSIHPIDFQAHPDGTVSKAEFKAIYNQQFPHGDSDAVWSTSFRLIFD